jgi:hypothetical protein
VMIGDLQRREGKVPRRHMDRLADDNETVTSYQPAGENRQDTQDAESHKFCFHDAKVSWDLSPIVRAAEEPCKKFVRERRKG